MTSFPHLQNQLRKQINELCEACFAEQEWLEDGRFFDPKEAEPHQATRTEDFAAAETTLSK